MFSITIKLMKKSARMLIPAGIAILIGTAFIAATFLFSNSMDDALRSQMTANLAEANYIAQKNAHDSAADPDEPTKTLNVSDIPFDRIRATSGVKGVRADMTVSIAVNHNGKNVNGIAVSTSSDRSLIPLSISRGDQPKDNNEIALPWSVAKQVGATIGDTVTVTIPSDMGDASAAKPTADVRVVGLTEDPNGVYSFYGGGSVVSDNILAVVTAGTEEFSQLPVGMILLHIDGDASQANQTVDQVKRLLPDGYTIETRKAFGDEAIKSIGGDQSTSITTTFLLSFGVLAMLVAALVIGNTFQVLVAQRRRTLALLRTIGAKKSQLYGSVVLEAGILGLISSMLGVGFGTGLIAAFTSKRMASMMGMYARFVMSWQAVVIPIAFGVAMTMLASLGSARSATSVTPLEALRPVELTDTRRAGHVRAVIGVLMVVLGLALASFAIWQMSISLNGSQSMIDSAYSTVLLASMAGAALVFLGLMVTATFWLPVLMRGVGAIVAVCGPSAKIAHANIQKNPRRVAATGTALLIGVTLVSTIATGAASGKQTMGEALASRYSVDMILSGDGLNDKTVEQVRQIKGVTGSLYAPTAVASTKDPHGNDMTMLLVGVKDTAQLSTVMRADLNGVTLGQNDVIVQRYRADSGKKLEYADGTRLELSTATDAVVDETGYGTDIPATPAATQAKTGTIRQGFALTPVSVDFRRVTDSYGSVAFISDKHFTNGDITASGHMLLMKVDADKAGVTLSSVFDKMQSIVSSDPTAQVTGPVTQRAQWETIIDNMMLLLVGLIAVAVLIALIGVANTLSLSVIERTRESATLRAIGMTRGQLRLSLAIEALMLSLVAGVVGVILGTLFGWLGSYMVFSLYGTPVLPVDWSVNGIVLAVAAVAALLASVAPARRAVRVPPVEALAEA